MAFGPRTLALGGREFDDVILHTYFTLECNLVVELGCADAS
ncbi:MAG: hypothetical protein QOG79_4055, partial [Mycobacterium sp.]|nr:hypothetical protein [Mycobacterium sp.]